MPLVLLCVRLLLAAVFAAAAIGKLLDLDGFRRTLGEFGVPGPAVGGLRVLVPAAELVAAVLLVPAASAMWGAASSLLLLAAFTLAVVINLTKGRRPDCRCFGQVSVAPIGAATLARNLVLASAATLVLLAGPGAALDAAGAEWSAASPEQHAAWLGELAVVALLAGLAERALRLHLENRRLRQRVETLERQLAAAVPSDSPAGLPIGTPAPAFDFPLLAGDHASLASLTAGSPLVLIFSSSDCPVCGELWRDIEAWQRDYKSKLRIAVVGSGSAQVMELKMMGFEVQDVLLAGHSKVPDAYRLPGIPSAVVIGPDGGIASKTALGPIAIRDLVRQQGRELFLGT